MPVPPKLNAAPKSFKSPSKEEFFELAGADSNTGIRDNSGNLGGDGLLDAFSRLDLPRSRAGVRHAMRLPAVAKIARSELLLGIAQVVLGGEAFPFRATLFDKSPTANWLVVWHQDTALPLRERRETHGWGPWS